MRRATCVIAAVTVGLLTLPAIAGDGPKITFSGPGTLGPGPQGCLAFQADVGGVYVLENAGDFFHGDRVFVTGLIDPESQLCFPVSFPGIVDNEIQAFFEGCGVLTFGPQGCLGFQSEDGQGFFIQNTGGYGPGRGFFVTGPINEESFICFPVIAAAIEDNTVSPCLDGDVNADGSVDVTDLANVITSWGDCPPEPFACPADLNGDGQVNVEDLVRVIQNWS